MQHSVNTRFEVEVDTRYNELLDTPSGQKARSWEEAGLLLQDSMGFPYQSVVARVSRREGVLCDGVPLPFPAAAEAKLEGKLEGITPVVW